MQLTVAIKVHVIYFYTWLNKYYCLNSQVVTSASRRFHGPLLGQNPISLVLPDTWEKRTNKLDRTHADSERFARCQTDVNAVVRLTGTKYSVLFQLPYYDAVRFVIIDPVHLLFLVWPKQPWRFGRRMNWSRINILTCCRGELMLLFHRRNWKDPFKDFHRIQWI